MSSIIAAIDNLVDFKSTTRECYVSTSFNSKVNDKEEKKKSGRGTSKVVMDKDKTKLMGAQGKSTKPKFNYFICDGPHFARECPKRDKLNVIQVGDNDKYEGVVTIYMF